MGKFLVICILLAPLFLSGCIPSAVPTPAALVLSALLMFGCATQKVSRVPVVLPELSPTVVLSCPTAPVIRRPILQIESLSSVTEPVEILKAYVHDVPELIIYSLELESALSVYGTTETTQGETIAKP